MSNIVDKFIFGYNSETDTEKRFRSLIEFVNVYYDSDFLKVNILLEKELELCMREKLVDGEAMIRFMLGYSAFEQGDLQKGNEEVNKVMAIFDRVTSHEVRAQVLNFLAYIHSHQGNFEKAFQNIYECIREAELAEDKKNQYWGVYTLGVFHFDLKDYANAEKCFSEAVAGFTKNDNPDKIEQDLMNLFPKDEWFCINYLLIAHGRKICQAKKPLCPQCPVNKLCPSAKKFYPDISF